MTSPRIDRIPEIPPPLKFMLTEAGLDPASYQGPVDGIRKAVQRHLREHATAEGRDYSELNDDQLTDDYNYLVFPNITFNTHADHLMLFRHRPHASDPNKMYFDVWMLEYIVDPEEMPDERPRHRFYEYGEKSLGMVIDQDGANLPKVQQGMQSAAFDGLWLGDLEVRLRHFPQDARRLCRRRRGDIVTFNNDDLARIYRQMRTIREFEERLHLEIQTGEIAGFTHLYSGQEAVAVGVCDPLDDADTIVSTHRGHGHCIAKGCDITAMMLEIYGRAGGLCKGKGGSMHIADFNVGMLGANGIVGGGPPIAVGAALAARIDRTGRVSVAFGGDGSSNQGTVFEAMNMAVVLGAPAIFVFGE